MFLIDYLFWKKKDLFTLTAQLYNLIGLLTTEAHYSSNLVFTLHNTSSVIIYRLFWDIFNNVLSGKKLFLG